MISSKISIVLPTFNHARYLPMAIESVLHQTHQNFELIIIDDGSTDETPDFLASVDDNRILFLKNKQNRGLTASWNIAMSKATGTYCCQLDADDTLPPNSLELRINAIGDNDAIFSSLTKIEGEHSTLIYQPPLNDQKIIGNFLSGKDPRFNINIGTLLFRPKVLAKIGYRTSRYSTHADYEFCLKLILGSRVTTLNQSTYNYIHHEKSMSNQAFKNSDELDLYQQLCKYYAKEFQKKL